MKLVLFAFLAGIATPSLACDIVLVDLEPVLVETEGQPMVMASQRVAAESGEPIRRYVLDYGDGALYVLEEQSCSIHNFRFTILGPSPTPRPEDAARAASVLPQLPIWKEEFSGDDVFQALMDTGPAIKASDGNESFVTLDGQISAATNTSSAVFHAISVDPFDGQFEGIMTLSVAVGFD